MQPNLKEITNAQNEAAMFELQGFNPAKVPFSTKIRMSRNLERFAKKWKEKEQDRNRLCASHVLEKGKAPTGPNGQIQLTAQEMINFDPDLRELMARKVQVFIQPIYLFDSRDEQTPPDSKHAIDVAKVEIPISTLSALIDIMFIPVGVPAEEKPEEA